MSLQYPSNVLFLSAKWEIAGKSVVAMISHIEKVESLVIQRFLEIVGSAQFLSRTAKLPHSVKLKIHRWRQRTGSSPVTGTTSEQTSYRLLRLFYKSQSALTPLLLLSKPNPLSLGFGLGPPLRGGFVLLQENIGRNQPFHIVFSPSEYIPSVDEHKSSGAGTIKCRTARNRWEGVRFFWTVSHTDVSLKGVVPDGRKKQAYPACAHCQERMK